MTKIDAAIAIFKKEKTELSFKELFNLLVKEYGEELHITSKNKESALVDFYTSLSNDGRFIFDKSSKKWGLMSLLNPDVIRENKTGYDELDDETNGDKDDDDEDILDSGDDNSSGEDLEPLEDEKTPSEEE